MGQVATEIAREAEIRTHTIGRSELIGRDELDSFLEACKRADGLIVGIEGFRRVGHRIEPDMEWIADFSVLSDPAESISEARDFVEAAPIDLYFDFNIIRKRAIGVGRLRRLLVSRTGPATPAHPLNEFKFVPEHSSQDLTRPLPARPRAFP